MEGEASKTTGILLPQPSLTIIQSVKQCLCCWWNSSWALGDRWGLAMTFGTYLDCPHSDKGFFFFSCPSNKTGICVATLGLFFPLLQDAVLQNITSWHLSATRALMWLYFHFQPCHFKEAQLWQLVLLQSPVNGSSYRNMPLSSLVMIPGENCFQASAIQTQTNLLSMTTFLFYLLQKLSTWLMTLHSCVPKAQM